MPARVPQDVDLEDKLVFGLSPIRFGYLVIGVILAAGIWATRWPTPLKATAVIPVAAAAALGVGLWRGHRLDSLAWDLAVHLLRNYRLELSKDLDAALRRTRRGASARRKGRTLTVTALEPGVGATTVALELAVGLALSGESVQVWEPRKELNLRLGLMAAGRHQASGLDLLSGYALPAANHQILVRSLPAGEEMEAGDTVVLVLGPSVRNGTPPGVLPLINRGTTTDSDCPAVPDDPHVQRAEALRESVLVAFPDAPASRAFRALAASLKELIGR